MGVLVSRPERNVRRRAQGIAALLESNLSVQFAVYRNQSGNIRINDAPNRVVVDAQVAVNQAVARREDLPPRNVRVCSADPFGNVGRGLSNQLQIAQVGIISQAK
jgi:hypothetical protein